MANYLPFPEITEGAISPLLPLVSCAYAVHHNPCVLYRLCKCNEKEKSMLIYISISSSVETFECLGRYFIPIWRSHISCLGMLIFLHLISKILFVLAFHQFCLVGQTLWMIQKEDSFRHKVKQLPDSSFIFYEILNIKKACRTPLLF